MTRTTLHCLVLGLLAGLTSSAFGQLPLPELKSIYPPGAKKGASVEVKITGTDIDGASQLQFSHEGITAEQKVAENDFGKMKPVANTFAVKVADNVPPGVYEVRAVGQWGVSTPRSFQVGEADEMMDDGSNKTFDKPKELPLGTIVNGVVDSASRDYFKLSLKNGQRVLIECTAEQIDSRMDATLVVYDPSGRELVRDRDTTGLDPLIDFTAPADGDYIVGLYDFLYSGGAEYVYRLSAHTRPHVDFVFPPSGLPGSTGKYTIYGRNLPGGQPTDDMTMGPSALQKLTVDIKLPDGEESQQLALGAYKQLQGATLDRMLYQLKTPQGAANPVPIYFAKAPVIVEKENNDKPEQAQQITVPCEFVGQFYPQRDFDWVQFEAKSGQVYWIDVISHRLGFDSDPIIRVQRVTKNAEGQEQVSDVATVDDPGDRNTRITQDFDTSTDDPSYRFQVPADGIYRVQLRDQFGASRKDPRYVYRLLIREEQPDFRLVARPMPNRVANNNQVPTASAVIRKSGTTLVEVRVERTHNFQGDIEISAEGLPAGVTCPSVVVGGSTSSTTLIFSAADDAKPWVGPVRITGKAKVNDKELTRVARTGSVIFTTTNRTTLPPGFRLTGDLVLSVIDSESDPATIIAGDGKVIETSKGAKFDVPVKVTRRNGYKADLKLTAVGLPKELKPGDITVKGNAADGKVAFSITNNAAKPGAYTFYLQGDATFPYKKETFAQARAEAEQKEIDEIVKQLTEEVKKAQEAQKAAGDDKDKKAAADKALADANAKLKKAQAAKKTIDGQVKTLTSKKPNAKFAVRVYSTPVRLQVAASPMKLTATAPGGALKQGAKVEVPVKLEKLFGFDDAVELTIEAPKGVAGLSAAKASLAKGKADGKLEIAAAGNATPGEHTITVHAKAKFNNVNVQASQQITVKVEAVEAKK